MTNHFCPGSLIYSCFTESYSNGAMSTASQSCEAKDVGVLSNGAMSTKEDPDVIVLGDEDFPDDEFDMLMDEQSLGDIDSLTTEVLGSHEASSALDLSGRILSSTDGISLYVNMNM